eukprot:TRINITY_DN4589_c0_g1_i1.p1 TRINITY_DN4589_c0_g1~~TRINITY_DN4589_c0_g1_i1.p1  ORF type:complete len:175 (-),score=31.70 TRINITY_DN4589_c0_g1_i1:472-996(-)
MSLAMQHPQPNQPPQFHDHPVVAPGDEGEYKPCNGCCPAPCYTKDVQVKMAVSGGCISLGGFFMWVAFANAQQPGGAVVGFFVMLIAGTVSIIGCSLFCASEHRGVHADGREMAVVQGQGPVLMVQHIQPQTTGIPVGQVVHPVPPYHDGQNQTATAAADAPPAYVQQGMDKAP